MPEKKVCGIVLRQVFSFERYWISCDGNYLWADPLTVPVKHYTRSLPGTWVNISLTKKHRKAVRITGKAKIPVARLVALAWIGEPPKDKPWVLHRDDNCTNDHYTNLYWGDRDDNAKDRQRLGGYPARRKSYEQSFS